MYINQFVLVYVVTIHANISQITPNCPRGFISTRRACSVPIPVIETGDAEDEDGAQDVDAVHHGQAEHQLVEVTLHNLNIIHNHRTIIFHYYDYHVLSLV